MAAVTICSDFGASQNKVSHCFSLSVCHEVMGPGAMILVFWMLSVKPASSLSSFTLIKRLLSSSWLSAIRMVSSAYLRPLTPLPAIRTPACVHPAWHFAWCTLHISWISRVTIYSLEGERGEFMGFQRVWHNFVTEQQTAATSV